MADIWLISDTHFGHDNIIKYSDRPFSNVHEMNERMIERWNSVVKPQDKVYHLGDVYMGSGEDAWDVMSRLNGKKRLILGNHDNALGKVERHFFQKIMMWRVFKEFNMVLTHVPIHEGSIRGGGWNVHGHIHNRPPPKGPYYCVCVEQTYYTPINIVELSDHLKEYERDAQSRN